ncbi:MAG: hypothetical protein KDA80_22370 [Planctomycetaceae bacterium]|nr:hypothetical protein [Planctomycetaceae bacterium]
MAASMASPVQFTRQDVHEQWDDFAPEEIDWVDGDPVRLIQAVATKYGVSRDEAAWQVTEFLNSRHSGAKDDTIVW